MDYDNLPTISWPEVVADFLKSPALGEVRQSCLFELSDVPLVDLGTEYSPGKLVSAVMERYPEAILQADGRKLWWECLEQRDVNAHRLLGGGDFPLVAIKKAIDSMAAKWPWSEGHVAVLTPYVLFGGHFPLRSNEGQVRGQVGFLPPIECMGVLRSAPLDQSREDASSLAVLWYQTGFGIEPSVIEQIQNLDWARYAYSYDY